MKAVVFSLMFLVSTAQAAMLSPGSSGSLGSGGSSGSAPSGGLEMPGSCGSLGCESNQTNDLSIMSVILGHSKLQFILLQNSIADAQVAQIKKVKNTALTQYQLSLRSSPGVSIRLCANVGFVELPSPIDGEMPVQIGNKWAFVDFNTGRCR